MKLISTLKGFLVLLSFLCIAHNATAQYDLVVAKDGSGNYTTVQAAIDASPTGRVTPYVIFIKNGKYKEKINVPSSKPFIQLIGESVANVVLTYDDYSGKPMPGGGTFGTGNSASVTVAAADFTAVNITFENTTGESPQALAINVTGDRAAFKLCRFLGGQDTVFAGGNGARQNFRQCYIDGTVDFIFGDARAVFDSCVIYAKTRSSAGSSFITAANTKQAEPYGYVFRDSKIPANRGGTVYFLGRPWQNDASTADAAKSYNKTIFINTTMSSSIQNAGWTTWDAGTDVSKITYAEYRSKKFDSSLVDVSQRPAWSRQLTATEALTYNNTNLFGSWNPCTVTASFCAYSPMPIAVSNFKGVKGTSTSAFTWNISWPMTGIKYEVLRSSDRITFTKVNEQTSMNDSAVNFAYSENIPAPGVTYYYLIQASKPGLATHVSDTVAISSTPTINVTGSMGNFVQGVGTPSNSQSYVVSGASLTNNLIINSPVNYELSTNGTTWNTSSNPVVLTQDANGNVPNTTIFVRLNASTAGTYNGTIVHTSTGADTVRLNVAGTVQSDPLTVSEILQWWPFTQNGNDSAAIRSNGVAAAGNNPSFSKLYLSNGSTVPVVPAYSATHGQAFGATANGDGTWSTAAGGPGGNLNRTFYEQFVIKAGTSHSLRIDSLILSSSFYNTSSNTKLAVVYSKRGFTTADSVEVSSGIGAGGTSLPPGANGGFVTPVLLTNETGGTTTTYRFAISVDSLRNLSSGDSLTVRLYFSCGSSSVGRYAKLKNVLFKGLATMNPVASDYRTKQSGNWTDLNTWERYDGSAWVYPSPSYPVYNNANTTTILNGHTVTISATLPNGSGYIDRTKINTGGQLIVNNGANLNIANDGAPSTATIDLQVDGTFTNFGGLFTNGNVSVLINGNFVHSGTGMNWSNTGDTVTVGAAGKYQHNVNSNTTPANMVWLQGSTFLITGITTNQTGIFKNNIKYFNIIWNNTAQANYYAFRLTLDSSNVKGSFTMQSTGSTYVAFSNANGRVSLPGGYYQTGGTVNFRESNNIADTLDIGGDFNVTGGSFASNTGSGSSLLIRLNGFNKTLTYAQNTATNTNWHINGSYTSGSALQLPVVGYGMLINGTFNMLTNTLSGAGNVELGSAAVVSIGAANGIEGNLIITGTKTFSPTATYIFNGTAAQSTGTLFPAMVGAVTINNAFDVTLNSGNTTIAGALTLAAGKFIINANTVTANSVLSSTASKYVVTNGGGFLKINNIGAGGNAFPVGPTTSTYNPVVVNNAGVIDNFSVAVKTTFDTPVPDANKVVNRQWTINEDVAGGSNATVSLSWVIADQAPGFDPASSISIIRYNGAMWQSYPATITGAGTTANPYVATASGVTAFSPFTVINNTALPLYLISFKGNYTGVVNLVWTTSGEVNTKHFVIERSNDGTNFKSIGMVQATNTAGVNQYSFVDASGVKGLNYYRLQMVDKDGQYSISNVVTINIARKGKLLVYGNPAGNTVLVSYPLAAKGAYMSISTVDGKLLQKQIIPFASTQQSLDVSMLKQGIYLLSYYNNNYLVSTTFVKQ